MVAGLVASAAMCAIVPTWAAILGGAIAAILAQALAHAVPLIGIDDPVNAGATSFVSLHHVSPVSCFSSDLSTCVLGHIIVGSSR